MRHMRRISFLLSFALLLFPVSVLAMPAPLQQVYDRRADLQAVFDEAGEVRAPGAAGFLIHLEDWAAQYGWQTEPELAAYIPEYAPPVRVRTTPAPVLGAASWIVVDRQSGQILAAEHAEKLWPIASITKLMTSDIVTSRVGTLDRLGEVRNADDVGGARLYVTDGTLFTLRELLSATLIGSANNAANALSRTLGISGSSFVAEMNARAQQLGLRQTRFTDPTGIELGNVSTARETAQFARAIFAENEAVRKTTQTVRVPLTGSDQVQRTITTTNWMLYKPAYDDVWVTAGKTGYLLESAWNVVEQLRPSQYAADQELVIVVLGSTSRAESFDAVLALSQWTWKEFAW